METGFLRVVFDPGHFFETRMRADPDLKVPVLIVLFLGLVGAISAVLTANLIAGIFPPDMQAIGAFMALFAAVTAVIGTFLSWIVYAGIFSLISMIFKGSGSFKRTLEFTGYGLLPQIFGGIIGIAFIHRITANLSNLAIPVARTPEEIVVATETLTSAMSADPLTLIAGIVTILFLVWSANIWIFGMKHARNLSTRDAVLTVAIPVGLYIVYLISIVGLV